MKVYKLWLSYFLAVFMVMLTTDVSLAANNPQTKKNTTKLQAKIKAPQKKKTGASPIVDETSENDTMPMEDAESDPDAIKTIPPRPKAASNVSPSDKDEKKIKKANKTKEKLLEGFRQAHQFHINWFNLPSTKIKSSHDNLTKFCKVACTKKNCLDAEVADKCHLMCPSSTTNQCPDPLRMNEDIDREEVMLGSDISLKGPPKNKTPVMSDDAITPNTLSPIEQAERSLDNIGEEG